MQQILAFNLSDIICLLLDAQRHALRGDNVGATRILASATELLKQIRPSGLNPFKLGVFTWERVAEVN